MSSADEHGSTCIDINLYTTSEGYKWQLGPCHDSHEYSENYETVQIFTNKCCLQNGNHIFSCNNKQGDGWANGVVRIGNHQFCDDFVGYNKLITINIPGIGFR